MKKRVIKLAGKILLPTLVLGVFVSACNSNDTNPATTIGTDTEDTSTLLVNTDTMMTDNTHTMTRDTATNTMMANTDSLERLGKDTASKATLDKKGKKVRIKILPVAAGANTAAMEMDKDGFYKNTEILPAFPGGQKALERFFEDNIVYPEAATDNSTEGTIRLSFAVDENGKIYQPTIIGDKVGSGIEEEAIRVFNKMPKWTPGKIKGKNVKTRYTLPVTFQLY